MIVEENKAPESGANSVEVAAPIIYGDPQFTGEQVSLLFRNANVSIATTVAIAVNVYAFMASTALPYTEFWLCWTLLVAMWRGQLAWQYHRNNGASGDPNFWMEKFILGAFAAGAAWGLLGAFFYIPAPSEVRLAILMVLTGMAAGAMGVFAVEVRVFASFMLPMLLPMGVTLYNEGTTVSRVIASMGLIFVAVSLIFAKNTGRTIKEAISLKFAHEANLARLNKQIHIRDQISAELVARDSQMRMLGENVPALIGHYDKHEILRYCNHAYADLFDKKPASIIGLHAREILGEERFTVQSELSKRALQGEHQRYQSKRVKPDGAEALLEVHRAPFRSQSGVIEGHFLFAVDITEQNRLQEALRGSEAKARMFLQSLELSGEAIFSKALDGIITSWNRGAERIYGFSADEAIGRSMRELHMGKLSDQEYEAVLKRIADGESETFVARRQHKDGSTIHVLVSTSPILDDDGTLLGETTVARDITAMRQAQLDLAETERELRLLIDNTPAMICHIDTHSRYRMVNIGYAARYGLTPAELVGRDYREVMEPASVKKIEHHFQLALKGQTVRYERSDTARDGTMRDLVVH